MACRNCVTTCTCLLISGDTDLLTVEGDGSVGTPYEITAVAQTQTDSYTFPGTLTTDTGTVRRYFTHAATIIRITASVGTAPTGDSIKVDVHKNGTTIFTTQGNRPTIPIGSFYNTRESVDIDVTAIAANDYLTIDIDQIGSGVAGADLVVTIEYTR